MAQAPMVETPATPPPQGTPANSKQPHAFFRDFDAEDVYKRVKDTVLGADAKNFVVEFGPTASRIAWDLNSKQFEKLLQEKRNADDYPVRWINIWNSHKTDNEAGQIIQSIGNYYRFSNRLTTSIHSWDQIKGGVRSYNERKRKEKERRSGIYTNKPAPRASGSAAGQDAAEKGAATSGAVSLDEGQNRPSAVHDRAKPNVIPPMDLPNYRLTHDTLNYTAIDQVTDQLICIGANWLHLKPSTSDNTGTGKGKSKTPSLIPPKHWSWSALCCDRTTSPSSPNTVLTFHEAPYYYYSSKDQNAAKLQDGELGYMRANIRKCLLQLSVCGIDEYKAKIFEIANVRKQMQVHQSHEERPEFRRMSTPQPFRTMSSMSMDSMTSPVTTPLALEGASSLFYYLFEDYLAIPTILNESRDRLENLAQRVLFTASRKDHSNHSDIIPSLYTVSKELRQLKHLFESYKTLVTRILAYSGPGADTAKSRLAPSARDRFERLNDRVQLMMLDIIDEYLEENKSLSDTYFNLTAQKDSEATARLTRSATLLAKLSVFFLPISYITSFFSIQLGDVLEGYTKHTYWSVFAVTVSVSFLCLFFFSRLLMFVSETLDTATSRSWAWCLRLVGRRSSDEDDEGGNEVIETKDGE